MSETTNFKANSELLQVVSFNIGEEEFGVDILKVQEINKISEITSIPDSPSHVEGVINLRGKVIPIIDLRVKLGTQKKVYDHKTRILVVEIDNKTVGFVVDSVKEVLRIPQDIIEPPPKIVEGINSEYITAIGKLDNRLLILLDMEKVLTDEEINTMAEISA
ncbi:MAG: chemotaxis protein CheW [Rhodothermaceae bacterium]